MKIPLIINNISLNNVVINKTNYFITRENKYKTSIYTPYDKSENIKIDEKEKIKVNFLTYIFSSKSNRKFLKIIKLLEKNNLSEARRILTLDDEKNKNNSADIWYLKAMLSRSFDDRLHAFKKTMKNGENYGNLFNKYNLKIVIKMNLLDNICFLLTNDFKGLYIYLSCMLYRSKNSSEALNLLNNINSHDMLIKLIRAELHLKNKSYKEVIDILQDNTKLENINFINNYSKILTAVAFRKMGIYNSSISILKKIRRNYKNTPETIRLEARYQLAKSLKAAGKKHLAQKELENILSVNYQYKNAKEIFNKVSS